jgi:hypothetical protein
MSTAVTNFSESELQAELPRVRRSSTVIRRRPTPEQGRALEMLGHAVEYLVDSGLYRGDQSDELAVQMLMRLNREVFAECAEVVPLRRRLRRRWADRLEAWGFR